MRLQVDKVLYTNLPGYGNAVELGHELGCVGENVTNDSHAVLGRVDVRVPHHELFQDVVLSKTVPCKVLLNRFFFANS